MGIIVGAAVEIEVGFRVIGDDEGSLVGTRVRTCGSTWLLANFNIKKMK